MDALDIARMQIGVTEWPRGSNRVIYNRWYYGQEVYDGLWGTTFPWCMAFVQWCHAMAGSPLPCKTASCAGLLNWYREHAPERVTDRPVPGAVVIYDGHCGIVENAAADGKTFTAIEGNTSVTDFANGGEVARVYRRTERAVAFIVTAQKEENVKRYDSIEELPEHYRGEASRLVERGALRGRSDGRLDITEDMLRTLIICQRMIDEK